MALALKYSWRNRPEATKLPPYVAVSHGLMRRLAERSTNCFPGTAGTGHMYREFQR